MGKSRKTMGISRDSFHKRRKTGGKLTPWRKKRKFELGRPPSMTKIGGTRIHTVRVRGGSMKYRALRLDSVYDQANKSDDYEAHFFPFLAAFLALVGFLAAGLLAALAAFFGAAFLAGLAAAFGILFDVFYF